MPLIHTPSYLGIFPLDNKGCWAQMPLSVSSMTIYAWQRFHRFALHHLKELTIPVWLGEGQNIVSSRAFMTTPLHDKYSNTYIQQ